MANDENGDRIGNDAISDVNPGMYGDVTDDTKRRNQILFNQILSFKVYLYGRGNYCTAKRGIADGGTALGLQAERHKNNTEMGMKIINRK